MRSNLNKIYNFALWSLMIVYMYMCFKWDTLTHPNSIYSSLIILTFVLCGFGLLLVTINLSSRRIISILETKERMRQLKISYIQKDIILLLISLSFILFNTIKDFDYPVIYVFLISIGSILFAILPEVITNVKTIVTLVYRRHKSRQYQMLLGFSASNKSNLHFGGSKLLLIGVIVSFISACSTSTPTPIIKTELVCPKLYPYTLEQNQKYAEELTQLNESEYPTIVLFLGDYYKTRQGIRQCIKSQATLANATSSH